MVERAEADARRWQVKAEQAEKRAAQLTLRAAGLDAAAVKARQERDAARRLLTSKMQWSRDARRLVGDPEALLALVADLRQELERCRRELAAVRRISGVPPAPAG